MIDTIKTDRELLELAAKAAKMNTREFATDSITRWHWREDGTHTAWNPLTDDGDALRLAVKLRFTVRVWVNAIVVDDCAGVRQAYEDTGCRSPDYEAEATRRAITRAAAAIGEGMK